MPGPLLLHQDQNLLLFKLASDKTKNNAIISFGSHDGDVSLFNSKEFPLRGNIRKVAALIGVIKLKVNKYIIVANRVESAGNFNGHSIFKVVEHSIFPLNKSIKPDNDESQYLSLLDNHLSNASLFFSYTYDLTNSAQRNNDIQGTLSWKTIDKRFCWNYYATQSLQHLALEDSRVNDFIVPMIYGYVKIVDTVFHSSPITMGLITRRSIYRSGTRYFCRGIDENGNVGNYNETEQILLTQSVSGDGYELFSFLQTRGSVPVQWAEMNNLKYKPNLMLGEVISLDATKKHFNQQKTLYGVNYLVNLVNQNGYELPIKETYESVLGNLDDPNLRYIYFDFHHECRKMQWHRINLLIDYLKNAGLDNKDVFHKLLSSDGSTIKIVSKQKSIVRTNCMDCLDRTNVVQSVLAHWVLQQAFETAMLTSPGDLWENDKTLLLEFRNFWADNADYISCAYSGTGALKTDFTRTGKRTINGIVQDLINSLSRYYQNNLTDGPRQDGYDLFLGNFKPHETSIYSPFHDRRPLLIQTVPTIIYAALTVIAATIFFPKDHFTSLKNISFFFGSSIIVTLSVYYIIQNGEQYVNWPKLVNLNFLTKVQLQDNNSQVKGIKYTPNSKFVKPNMLKRD